MNTCIHESMNQKFNEIKESMNKLIKKSKNQWIN
jgi:hypothetical protein